MGAAVRPARGGRSPGLTERLLAGLAALVQNRAAIVIGSAAMPSTLLRSRLLLVAALLAACLSGARPAAAQWQCPVGVDPMGQNTSGIACVWIDDAGGDDEGDYGGSAPPMQHYSPKAWQAFVEAGSRAEHNTEVARKLEAAYRTLKAGTWDFSESPPRSKQHFCVASFLTLHGGAMLMNVSGKDGSSFLGYFGEAIPPAKRKPEKVVLSLTQSGKTQTVHAFHVRFPLARSQGMYLFAVPGTDALLNAIEDAQDYTVARNGEIALQGQWHDGLKARDWLRSCVAK